MHGPEPNSGVWRDSAVKQDTVAGFHPAVPNADNWRPPIVRTVIQVQVWFRFLCSSPRRVTAWCLKVELKPHKAVDPHFQLQPTDQ